MLTWLGAASLIVAGTPYMMLAADPTTRSYAFATQAAALALSGFLGGILAGILPALVVTVAGGSLDDPAPYRTVLWITPLTYVVAVFVFAGASSLQLETQTTTASEARAPVHTFAFLAVIVVLPAFGGGSARAFVNVLLDVNLGVHPGQIGFIMGFGQLLPVFVAMLVPHIIDRWGAGRTLALVGAGMSLGLVLMAFAVHWLIAALGFTIVIGVIGANGTSLNIFSQEIVPQRWRTISAAVTSSSGALAWSAAAAMGGVLVGVVGFRGYFLLCALFAFCATPLILTYLRTRRVV